MARGKKANAEPNALESLQAAVEFAGVANKPTGDATTTHLVLYGGWLYAFDGVLAVGHPLGEDWQACPHAETFRKALKKCGATGSMTQQENGHLVLRSGKFSTVIPCVGFDQITPYRPDPEIAPVNDQLKIAFGYVSPLVREGATTVLESSVLLRANTITATDRKIAVEYWHGIDLPPGLVLPKGFIDAVAKTPKVLRGFGFSTSTVTLYFDDGSWIRGNRYQDEWPDMSRIFKVPSDCCLDAVKRDLFKAIEHVLPFSPDGHVHFTKDGMRSHIDDKRGARFEIKLPTGLMFLGAQLAMLDKLPIDNIDFQTFPNAAHAFGSLIRVAVAKATPPHHAHTAETVGTEEEPSSTQEPRVEVAPSDEWASE